MYFLILSVEPNSSFSSTLETLMGVKLGLFLIDGML